MKKYVRATRVEEFMKYHEDPDNYASNNDGFDKMYDILNQYGTENEDVDVVFKRATPEDQQRMIDLIKPEPKLSTPGYARAMYRKALRNDYSDFNYCDGIKDAFEALAKEGYIDLAEFNL